MYVCVSLLTDLTWDECMYVYHYWQIWRGMNVCMCIITDIFDVGWMYVCMCIITDRLDVGWMYVCVSLPTDLTWDENTDVTNRRPMKLKRRMAGCYQPEFDQNFKFFSIHKGCVFIVTLSNCMGPSWSWSFGSGIYHYLLKLRVRIPLMARCTRYNIMW